jgi:hemolysin activation/secretion protein
MGEHNGRSAYSLVRLPADPTWNVGRFGALLTQRLPRGFMGLARLTGQYTDQALIPGEQFGLGGARTVRGFEERTIAGDRGVILNLELWTPPVQQLYGVQFLGFVDMGHKGLIAPQIAQLKADNISSVGIGARWQWRKQLAFAVDYGLPLKHAGGEASDRGNSKWHLDLQYRY